MEKTFRKNDIVQVQITDIGTNGEGIGKTNGFTLFVRDAVMGDLVEVQIMKVKKRYGYARLLNLIEPSALRVEPPCPVFGPCGGCQIQNMRYDAQLEWKEKTVVNDLEKIGGFRGGYELEPIAGMETPYRYRNKAIFPIRTDRNGALVAGFYAQHSHRVVPLFSVQKDGSFRETKTDDCLIEAPVCRDVLQTVLAWAAANGLDAYDEESGRGLLRNVLIRTGYHTGEILVCLIINAKKLPHADMLADALEKIPGMTSISYSPNRERTNTIMGKKVVTIAGKDSIEDTIGPIRYAISPLSFFQVNPIQTSRLYEKVLEYADLSGNEVVWDLYCGIGSISLFLAQKARRVIGVEIIPQAVEDAKQNALRNGLSNAEFYTGKAEEVAEALYRREDARADVVVVDPPRKGCDATLLETILRMRPGKVVYVSCNPATLARDLAILRDGGYLLKKVRPYDLFAHACHVETVALLTREK